MRPLKRGVRYRCPSCGVRVDVLVTPLAVACWRCAKAMRAVAGGQAQGGLFGGQDETPEEVAPAPEEDT